MLRRVFPKMRISDADINGWLSKAHRAVQQQSAVDKKNLTTENVRYGLQNAQPSKEGYIVEYVNENNGKFFYDHEMTEIEALADSVREETRVEPAKAFVNKIIQKVLLSSGFDVNSEKNLRFSIASVWTGSAADYDKPSLHAVGTGEGQQVYGWGLYGSESREVAEWYANNVAIMNESDNAPELAKGYKIAYDQITEEKRIELAKMKDKMLADKFGLLYYS